MATRTEDGTREDLRRRFVKAEMALFRIRYDSDDRVEREEFLSSRDFDWIPVSLRGHGQRQVAYIDIGYGGGKGEV